MSLQEKLDQIKAGFEAKAPAEAKAVMHQATDELRASGIMQLIPKVGDSFPHFVRPDQDNKEVASEALAAQGPLLFSFYRGKWWPYCRAEQAALQSAYEEIRSTGAELLSISPQLISVLKATASEDGLSYPLLADFGNGVARSMGMAFQFSDELKKVYLQFGIDLAKVNGDSSWELALPASVVVDTSGTIRFISADPDYTVRPEPEELLEVLRAL